MNELSTVTLGAAATLGVAASLVLALSPCDADPARPPLVTNPYAIPTNLAELRARGQAGLDELLARYRDASHVSTFDPRPWEAAIDTVAAQRYATYSGLYWYTDLGAAEVEAHRSQRPILALRMLGDLREDLSCANSRLFRATLYANQEVSAFLRSHFVLYWSSERPVPKITIDYGDGRKLIRTITGNSAHYVLDEAGHVLDVLPGLYAPFLFKSELQKSFDLATRVRGWSTNDRAAAVKAFHQRGLADVGLSWPITRDLPYIHGHRRLIHGSAAAIAQRASMSKAIVEIPDLRSIGAIAPDELPADETDAWSAIGQALWHIDGSDDAKSTLLDETSLRLVFALADDHMKHDVINFALLSRLDQHIVADSAMNQLKLRPIIRRSLINAPTGDFAALNKWIYDVVFVTPASDPWLGLLPRTDFTGLPNDGVVMP